MSFPVRKKIIIKILKTRLIDLAKVRKVNARGLTRKFIIAFGSANSLKVNKYELP